MSDEESKVDKLEKKFDKFITNDFFHLSIKVAKIDAKQIVSLALLFIILGAIIATAL